MILKSFRVTEFRSVKDSGWIDAESITALIGTNESGKTNILLKSFLRQTRSFLRQLSYSGDLTNF